MKFECPTSSTSTLASHWQSLHRLLSETGSLCLRNQTDPGLDICTPDGYDLLVAPAQMPLLDGLLSHVSDLDIDSLLVTIPLIAGTRTLDCQPVDHIVFRRVDKPGPYLATDTTFIHLQDPHPFPDGCWRMPLAAEFQPQIAVLGLPGLTEAAHPPVAVASLELDQIPNLFSLDPEDLGPDTESHVLLSKYDLNGAAEGLSAHLVQTSREGICASLIYSDITLSAAHSGASI